MHSPQMAAESPAAITPVITRHRWLCLSLSIRIQRRRMSASDGEHGGGDGREHQEHAGRLGGSSDPRDTGCGGPRWPAQPIRASWVPVQAVLEQVQRLASERPPSPMRRARETCDIERPRVKGDVVNPASADPARRGKLLSKRSLVVGNGPVTPHNPGKATRRRRGTWPSGWYGRY